VEEEVTVKSEAAETSEEGVAAETMQGRMAERFTSQAVVAPPPEKKKEQKSDGCRPV
jgi:hypothetical protein